LFQRGLSSPRLSACRSGSLDEGTGSLVSRGSNVVVASVSASTVVSYWLGAILYKLGG
jgi:hypothetical protein